MEDDTESLTPKELFRRAKIEHYLERAEEFILMARYHPALRVVESVFVLDPENAAAKALVRRVEESLEALRHRTNGASNPSNGNGYQPAKGRRHELVMIVDQDERILISLAESVRRYGLRAVGAANYDEALELLATITPDLVVSEVNFETGPRGFDLYLWLKNNTATCDTPFLFLAARIDRDTLIAGKRFGVDDFILKPVDNDVITASILNCLARRKVNSTKA
jgi:PleD family two-component response regulator